MSRNGQKVFVAMSGGVDSSTAAALLQGHGYDVVGVFIKVWAPEFVPCTWVADRQDAMRVCALLDIPFLTFDFEQEYKRDVVDYMIREYRAGRTPNPDVLCNSHIKFGAFFRKAREMGVDYIATGHYARIDFKRHRLFNAQDKNKDQTYFLWTLTQEVLTHTLFPVGEYEKSKVRILAKRFGLPTAEKKDSQGLCFIGKLDMKEFLKRYIDEKSGDVLDESGTVIGAHDGVTFYTLGQRHGFHINPTSPSDKPHYVVAKDIEKNTLTVSTDPSIARRSVGKEDVHLTDVNWISGEPPAEDEPLQARSRYRGELFDCFVQRADTTRCVRAAVGGLATGTRRAQHCVVSARANVTFPKERPVTPSGQSLVFYRGKECLGGGIIV